MTRRSATPHKPTVSTTRGPEVSRFHHHHHHQASERRRARFKKGLTSLKNVNTTHKKYSKDPQLPKNGRNSGKPTRPHRDPKRHRALLRRPRHQNLRPARQSLRSRRNRELPLQSGSERCGCSKGRGSESVYISGVWTA